MVGAWSRELGPLLGAPAEDQDGRGYRHTVREIAQQPLTWLETTEAALAGAAIVERALARVSGDSPLSAMGAAGGSHPLSAMGAAGGSHPLSAMGAAGGSHPLSTMGAARGGHAGTMLFTGSGSSVYAGECLSPALQARLRLAVRAVPAGELLTHASGYLPPRGPCLIVSLARSGNSPESCGVVDSLHDTAPECGHLVITCNRSGRLATSYADDPRVAAIVLDDKTCDRSLVMTSSFTNMTLAGQILGWTKEPEAYRSRGVAVARLGAELLMRHADALARVARSDYTSAVYLGSGCRYGSARESALKMLEMTAGQVTTFPETYLGLRHGPMAAVDDAALVVCFLSSDPVVRAYEADLVRELDAKKLGARKVLVGQDVPADLVRPQDLVVDLPGLETVGDDGAALLDVMAGQLLALFRCLAIGLRPDMPSDEGVISRVVQDFAIHRRR
jgi:tagatose-6-phosphate ketose/aldose isomerase